MGLLKKVEVVKPIKKHTNKLRLNSYFWNLLIKKMFLRICLRNLTKYLNWIGSCEGKIE
jgi:hypothetical protein